MANFYQWLNYRIVDGWKLRTSWIASPVRELDAHELMGGHAIAQHVAVPPAALWQRLLTEGKMAVSSFWDDAVARASINYAVTTQFDAVTNWMFGGQDRRWTIRVPTPSRTSIGYGVVAGEAGLRYSREVTVILERAGLTFYILTGYPQLR